MRRPLGDTGPRSKRFSTGTNPAATTPRRGRTMTTGIGRDPAAWRRRWAAEQLGVSVGATPAEARAAFLARLPEVDFVPPSAWRAALRLLAGVTDRLPADAEEEARADEKRRLGEAVEEFAAEFWSLAVASRQQRWQALARECGPFESLRARLDLLRPGLGIGPLADHEQPAVVE